MAQLTAQLAENQRKQDQRFAGVEARLSQPTVPPAVASGQPLQVNTEPKGPVKSSAHGHKESHASHVSLPAHATGNEQKASSGSIKSSASSHVKAQPSPDVKASDDAKTSVPSAQPDERQRLIDRFFDAIDMSRPDGRAHRLGTVITMLDRQLTEAAHEELQRARDAAESAPAETLPEARAHANALAQGESRRLRIYQEGYDPTSLARRAEQELDRGLAAICSAKVQPAGSAQAAAEDGAPPPQSPTHTRHVRSPKSPRRSPPQGLPEDQLRFSTAPPGAPSLVEGTFPEWLLRLIRNTFAHGATQEPNDTIISRTGVKLPLPEPYNGAPDLEVLETWVTSLLRWMRLNNLLGESLNDLRLSIMGQCLKDKAAAWFCSQVEGTRDLSSHWTFETVVVGLHSRFLHSVTARDAANRYYAVYQGNRSVMEVHHVLLKYETRMVQAPSAYDKRRRFISALRQSVRTRLLELGYSPELNSYSKLLDIASGVEAAQLAAQADIRASAQPPRDTVQRKGVPKRSQSTGSSRSSASRHRPSGDFQTLKKSDRDPVAKPQSSKAAKPVDRPGGSKPPAISIPAVCFNCRQPGHIARDCPQPIRSHGVRMGGLRPQSGPSGSPEPEHRDANHMEEPDQPEEPQSPVKYPDDPIADWESQRSPYEFGSEGPEVYASYGTAGHIPDP
jgi:hypothetical protein